METTTTPLPKEQFDAYQDLAKEAQSADDLATLREMAEQDTGATSHEIEVKGENGEVQTISVTDIGKNVLNKTVKSTDEGMAQYGEDWHTDEK